MKRKNKIDLPPLDPEIKASGLRILEKAFGEFGATGGTPSQLREAVEREILLEKPQFKEDKEAVRNISRVLMARFFEIVADESTTPNGKKNNEILNKFIADSTEKYKKDKNLE